AGQTIELGCALMRRSLCVNSAALSSPARASVPLRTMPLSPQRGDGAAMAVDLVNSWDEYDDPPELLSARWLSRWLQWHGLEPAAAAISERETPRARTLRERLVSVFDARAEDDAVELLNALVAELGTPPRLERVGSDWRMRAWPDEDAGVD